MPHLNSVWELGGGYSQSEYVVIVQDLRVLVLASSILLEKMWKTSQSLLSVVILDFWKA
jgi:hypothetical protein